MPPKRVRFRAPNQAEEVLKIAEVAAMHSGRGNAGRAGRRRIDPGALIIEEEKRLVPAVIELWYVDRAAHRAAELVLMIGGARRAGLVCEVVVGVKRRVANVLPKVSMQDVGPRLDRGIHDPTRGMAEFRAEVARLQFEFLDGVRRRHDRRIAVVPAGSRDGTGAVNLDVVVNAIETKIVLRPIDAGNIELGVIRASRRAVPAASNPSVVQSLLWSGRLLTCSSVTVWPTDASAVCSRGAPAVTVTC